MANEVYDVGPAVSFELVLANFSKKPQRQPKGMAIAYGKRNPLAIITTPDEVGTKLEAVHPPLSTTTANDPANNESMDTNGPDEPTKLTDWRDKIDLGHIENY